MSGVGLSEDDQSQYDARAFKEAGIRHHHLSFKDCTEPSGPLVSVFLRIVDAACGAVAVHCGAVRGLTAMLIAVCMMRSHGFTARTAMGWLRLMRPGSVIGEQQAFLCTVQRLREEKAAARRVALLVGQRRGPARPGRAVAATAAREQAAMTAAGHLSGALDRQGAARMRAGRASS